MKKNIGVIFGGRSVEHEISIITSLQLMKAIDSQRYTVTPVYISPEGRWYTGEKLYEKSTYLDGSYRSLTEVTVLPIPGIGGLTVLNAPQTCQPGKAR